MKLVKSPNKGDRSKNIQRKRKEGYLGTREGGPSRYGGGIQGGSKKRGPHPQTIEGVTKRN